MKLLVLTFLTISLNSVFASNFKTLNNEKLMNHCTEMLTKKEFICTALKTNEISEFELNDELIQVLDERAIDYEISDVLSNAKTIKCVSKSKLKKMSCISSKELNSKSSTLTKFVEDLF